MLAGCRKAIPILLLMMSVSIAFAGGKGKEKHRRDGSGDANVAVTVFVKCDRDTIRSIGFNESVRELGRLEPYERRERLG